MLKPLVPMPLVPMLKPLVPTLKPLVPTLKTVFEDFSVTGINSRLRHLRPVEFSEFYYYHVNL